MHRITLFVIIANLELLALSTKAQPLGVEGIMNVALDCQVQQASGTTNLQINTQSLLELIAKDQGFTLPAHAKLWLGGDSFVILKQDNTPFTNVDVNILNVTCVATVLKSDKSTNSTHPKTYVITIKGTSVVALNYNGTSISFNLNFVGENDLFNEVPESNAQNDAVYTRSFTGSGLGSGTCGEQSMVVTGSLTGTYSMRYVVGGTGTFP